MTISTDLAISNSMSSFVPKYWLNWPILVAILMNFVDKDGASKVNIPVHPSLRLSVKSEEPLRRRVSADCKILQT